jgi:hypothetical protein
MWIIAILATYITKLTKPKHDSRVKILQFDEHKEMLIMQVESQHERWKPRILRRELEWQFIGTIKLGTNIFVRQVNIHSFENQICYATRNLVDNPINKNTRIQNKTNDSTSQMENPKLLGIMFSVNVPIPFQVFIQIYVSRCIHVFRHCIGCSKSFSLKSQSVY